MLTAAEVASPSLRLSLNDIEALAAQLKQPVEDREYGLIIGDDLSGRAPAMIIGGGINKFYKKRNQFGVPVRSIHRDNWRGLRDYLLSYPSKKRALLVTEAVKTGEAMKEYRTLVRCYGFKLDIATIDSEYSGDEYLKAGVLTPDNRFFSGFIGTSQCPLHGDYILGTKYERNREGDRVGRIDPYKLGQFYKAMEDIETVSERVADILAS